MRWHFTVFMSFLTMKSSALPAFLLLFLLLAIPAPTQAVPTAASHVVEMAKRQGLYESKAWLALLHYTGSSFFSPLESEADSGSFFLAKNGNRDPSAEMAATIRGIHTPAAAFKNADLHPRCRFPARFHYLVTSLHLDGQSLPRPACRGFDRFYQTLRSRSVTVVYAAAYINSPASMYGHTFLKFDRHPDDVRKQLLDLTFNYAANANPEDNSLVYSFRGIFGGYAGIYTFPTYHEKLKEYNDIENRDIWEYRLNFTVEEIDQLIRHIWEIQQIHFRYYFFDENCSYRILAVLSAARPEMDVMKQFRVHAIPLNTIRALTEGGHVAAVMYRPSFNRKIRYYQSQMSDLQIRAAYRLAAGTLSSDAEALNAFSDIERSQILDLAYDYLRQIMATDPASKRYRDQQDIAYRILLARSHLENPFSLKKAPIPSVRDDQGHETTRVATGIGTENEQGFLDLHYRASYHSLTDPPAGYMSGAELSFFDFQFRMEARETKRADLLLKRLDYIRIISLTRRDVFFQPLSWKFKLSTDHDWIDEVHRAYTHSVTGGVGATYGGSSGFVYGLVHGGFRVSPAMDEGYSLQAGMDLGCYLYSAAGQTGIQYQSFTSGSGHDLDTRQINMRHSIKINSRFNLEANISQLDVNGRSIPAVSLLLQMFY